MNCHPLLAKFYAIATNSTLKSQKTTMIRPINYA
jgi:hypothetical protein